MINEELARSGTEGLPNVSVDQSGFGETMHGTVALDVPIENEDLDQYVGD